MFAIISVGTFDKLGGSQTSYKKGGAIQ